MVRQNDDRVLSYTTGNPLSRPISRLAIISLVLSIFGDPYMVFMLMAINGRGYRGEAGLWSLLAMMAVTNLLPLISLWRIKQLNGLRNGITLAYLAFAIATAWNAILILIAWGLAHVHG